MKYLYRWVDKADAVPTLHHREHDDEVTTHG